MDHPSVTNVLEVRVTTAGRLSFVVEFVRGDPITKDCDRNGLTVVGRLHWFVQVCRAVAVRPGSRRLQNSQAAVAATNNSEPKY